MNWHEDPQVALQVAVLALLSITLLGALKAVWWTWQYIARGWRTARRANLERMQALRGRYRQNDTPEPSESPRRDDRDA